MTENGFMGHHCPDQERQEEIKSPRGQAAYSYYAEWMRLKKRSVPALDRFAASKQYTPFIKFTDWVERTAIPNPLQFIKVMVDTEVQPVLWCRDNTFAMYLQWYDTMYPPTEQFLETFDTLTVLALDHGVALDKIYETLGAKEIARLVKRRKLSPWLLGLSRKFLTWLSAQPSAEKTMVGDAINLGAYAAKFQAQSVLSNELSEACKAMNV